MASLLFLHIFFQVQKFGDMESMVLKYDSQQSVAFYRRHAVFFF